MLNHCHHHQASLVYCRTNAFPNVLHPANTKNQISSFHLILRRPEFRLLQVTTVTLAVHLLPYTARYDLLKPISYFRRAVKASFDIGVLKISYSKSSVEYLQACLFPNPQNIFNLYLLRIPRCSRPPLRPCTPLPLLAGGENRDFHTPLQQPRKVTADNNQHRHEVAFSHVISYFLFVSLIWFWVYSVFDVSASYMSRVQVAGFFLSLFFFPSCTWTATHGWRLAGSRYFSGASVPRRGGARRRMRVKKKKSNLKSFWTGRTRLKRRKGRRKDRGKERK